MKRLLFFIVLFLLVPLVLWAQSQKFSKIMIFPFKIVSKGELAEYSTEFSGALGSELTREGDVELLSGQPFQSAVQDRKVDPTRLLRIGERMGAQAAIWGTVTKLDDGYSVELWVVDKEHAQRPRLFSANGKDMEELSNRVKELAPEIGDLVLKRPKIGEIKIEGNKRIEKDAILHKLEVKPGSFFRKSAIGNEIREIYSMGYFEDVQIDAEGTPEGTIDLKVTVKERPSIGTIEIEGNKLFAKDEILDTLTTKSRAVASNEKIRDDIEKIKKMYEKSGYYQPKIEYEIKDLSQNEAKLVFKIDEGQKSYLTDIVLEGRKKLPESEARKLMTLKPKSWFWFLDDSGTFTKDKLEENRMRLTVAYMDNGFIEVQVGAPKMDFKDRSVTVTYPIREGNRYQVRTVKVDGDLVEPAEKFIPVLQVKPKTWFRRSLVGDDIKALTKIYNNLGYAYVDIEPRQKINEKHEFVDLVYHITKGERVTIEKVDVAGNERTRDKIIRRSLAISEGDLYSADRFDATKSRLEGTDFFEAVRLKTSPGSRPDLMNVTVEVLEKKTGSLSAGLGYSSQDGAMGNVNLQEKNLFGLGIMANAKANLSGRRNSYEGSVTYPWIFDLSLSGTVRGYKSMMKESNYYRDSEGFSVHLGHPLYGFWTMSTGFSRDSSKLTGFEQGFARSIVEYYKQYGTVAQKFTNVSDNAVSLSVGRDTRNHPMIPSGGSKVSFASRFSGFGGDLAFASHMADMSYYYPLFWRAIVKVHTSGSLLHEVGPDPIPFDRRLLLGGIGSVRGYQFGQIGPRDRYGNIIGGDRSLYTNLECLFPLVDQLKLNGVVFFDVGNAWNASESPFLTTAKAGAGVGIRWVSPMGPLRIEYGWKVSPEKGETPGAVAFSMGQLF
ncbi:MAG: outer membrane protein assembly factor BamA [Desulfomonile tiedjei]|nr:outer membrane protein assembly factor BamA [Desulfomonile tiedjei]